MSRTGAGVIFDRPVDKLSMEIEDTPLFVVRAALDGLRPLSLSRIQEHGWEEKV